MLGYVSLVYAFLGDTFVFNETLIPQELIGIIIIFTLNIILVVRQLSIDKEVKGGDISPEKSKMLKL